MNYFLRRRMFLILLFLFTGFSFAFAKAGGHKFVCISDVHFNPMYNSSLVDTLIKSPYKKWDAIFATMDTTGFCNYGEDTNYKLFNSFLNELSKVDSKPDFVIFTGDFLAHDFLKTFRSITRDTTQYASNAFIYKTFGFITSQITKHLPGVVVYFTLGNNDSYTGDYTSIWDGEFFHTTADLFFNNFIKKDKFKKSFYNTYPVSGCYSILLPDKKFRIISVNANFLSSNAPSNQSQYGQNVIDWLGSELKTARANNEKVWVLNHILPGIDVYDTMAKVKPGEQIDSAYVFFTDNYNEQFIKLIKQYGSIISACFGGHIHMDDFRLYKSDPEVDKPAETFIHIIPAVSPVFENNAAFQVFSYNSVDYSLTDFDTYYLDLSSTDKQWKLEYNFVSTYKQKGINAKSLNVILSLILNDTVYRNDYINYYNVSSLHGTIKDSWLGNWAGISGLTKPVFISLYNKYVK